MCIFVAPVSCSKDDDRSWTKAGSLVAYATHSTRRDCLKEWTAHYCIRRTGKQFFFFFGWCFRSAPLSFFLSFRVRDMSRLKKNVLLACQERVIAKDYHLYCCVPCHTCDVNRATSNPFVRRLKHPELQSISRVNFQPPQTSVSVGAWIKIYPKEDLRRNWHQQASQPRGLRDRYLSRWNGLSTWWLWFDS